MTKQLSPAIIKTVKLLHTPKGRRATQTFIAEGIRTVKTLLEANWKAQAIYITKANERHISQKLKPVIVSEADMERLSASSTPSGILAIFPIPKEPTPTKLSAGLVLAGVADPGNMGTLIRSCAAFGYKSVVVIEGCDPYSPKVVQASAGSIAHVTIFQWSWEQVMLHKGNLILCGLDAHGEDFGETIEGKPLIVVGNEAHGIPKAWLSECDKKMTIPTAPAVESLNAGIAGSIVLFLLSNLKK